ncbi:MAG TPA: hypothetical protein VFU35_01175 [Jatrophihabitans sp.]|nr:hypothetical protein [Jatrophihabitans sp.]
MSVVARAEALFLSSLQPSAHPNHAEIEFAIWWSLRTHGGEFRCAADVAAEYGEHPDTSAERMRWALDAAA